MVTVTSAGFKTNALVALNNAGLQNALAFSKPQFMARRTKAVAALPEFERLRDIGRDIINHALAHDARAAVLAICQAASTRTVTKRKSMMSEELGINQHEAASHLLRQTAAPGHSFMPRNVMLVTGPSRSADIEQTLELGAHGPRRLHVLLIEDNPAARRELTSP